MYTDSFTLDYASDGSVTVNPAAPVPEPLYNHCVAKDDLSGRVFLMGGENEDFGASR